MDYKEELRKNRREREARRRKKRIIKICIFSAIVIVLSGAVCFKLYTDKSKDKITPQPTVTARVVQGDIIASQAPTSPTPEITPEITSQPTEAPIQRRGAWEAIPEDIREMMRGGSLPQGSSVEFEDLAYLTIPHYDFNYNITEGHLVVNAQLADEVLDIFAELFDIKYPIERMQLVDHYGADDYQSIENNNTSAFNYRESTDGSGRLSKHALGCAIDINPQINPYVNSSGVGSHDNASEYWSRNVSSWSSDISKAAYIGTDAEIYRIFSKYGWEWGGAWSSYRDYQHFQKSV